MTSKQQRWDALLRVSNEEWKRLVVPRVENNERTEHQNEIESGIKIKPRTEQSQSSRDLDILKRTCPECNKVLNCPKDVTRHIRIVHRQDKPFVCKTCHHRFSLNYNLETHLKKRHLKVTTTKKKK